MTFSKKTLYIIGMPLNDERVDSLQLKNILQNCDAVIGESKKWTELTLKRIGLSQKKTLLLDPPPKNLTYELKNLSQTCSHFALFSDAGMPILFDPGREVLEYCIHNQFEIRTFPGATSWSVALCLSGWSPPFWVEGFLPQKKEERNQRLQELKHIKAHIVILDTPYRFQLLVGELLKTFGKTKKIFLSWEISKPSEIYFWGTLDELQKKMKSFIKGEFILVIQNESCN